MQSLKAEFIQTDLDDDDEESNDNELAMLLLLLIGLQYSLLSGSCHGSDDNTADDTSLVQQQFVKKLFHVKVKNSTHVAEEHPHSDYGYCGKYDGCALCLYYVNKHVASPEDTVLKITCDIVSCFGDDAYGENDPTEFLKWNLLSYQGISITLQLLNDVFSKSPNALYTQIPEERIPTVIHTLSQLLRIDHEKIVSKDSPDSAEAVSKTSLESPNKTASRYSIVNSTTLFSSVDKETKRSIEKNLVKILCLPFAIELEQSLSYEILCALHQSNTMDSLFQHVHRLLNNDSQGNQSRYSNDDDEQLGVVVGLIARLVLTDEMFIAQLKALLRRSEIGDVFRVFLYGKSCDGIVVNSSNSKKNSNSNSNCIRCDMLAILSHLARQSVDSVEAVTETLCVDTGKSF